MIDPVFLPNFQGHVSGPAIPAKLDEALRSRRPILVLVNNKDDTVVKLGRAEVDTTVPLFALIRALTAWPHFSSKCEKAFRLSRVKLKLNAIPVSRRLESLGNRFDCDPR
jgi:hypothetical protein